MHVNLTKKYEQALKDIAACPAEDCYDADDLARTMRQYAKDALGVYDDPDFEDGEKIKGWAIAIICSLSFWIAIAIGFYFVVLRK